MLARLLPSQITVGLMECGLSYRRGALSGDLSARLRSSICICALDVLSHTGWRNHSLIHSLSTRHSDLSEAEPTLTHMCIQMLHKVKMVSAWKSGCLICFHFAEQWASLRVSIRIRLHLHFIFTLPSMATCSVLWVSGWWTVKKLNPTYCQPVGRGCAIDASGDIISTLRETGDT